MSIRRSIKRTAEANLFRRATAAIFICATLLTPGASLGVSLLPTQGGQSEERSELEGSEHLRAALPQFRRHMRSKLNPTYNGGIFMGERELVAMQRKAIAAEQQSTSSPDGWTSRLQL